MATFSGPLIRYDCAGCGISTTKKLHIRDLEKQFEELKEAPQSTLVCAACGHPASTMTTRELNRDLGRDSY